jgi:DNA-directed RNA polymerase subunit K/omega
MGLHPIDQKKITKYAHNVYEAAVVASKRARIINDEIKTEFEQIKNTTSEFEDEFEERGNPELLKFSLAQEKLEKPHVRALHELINGEIKYRYRTDEL